MSEERPEPMNYAMLGEDRSSDEEKIDKYTGVVGWEYLRPHGRSGSLIWVDPQLKLSEVARAFTGDDGERVANWLGAGDLVKVGELHARQWEGGDERFLAVVVTPFVLMQPFAEAGGGSGDRRERG